MYVCGITPYDATHLGHAATYLTFDMVQRVLRDQGVDVRYVQNVTDVDDPLIERAERDGISWQDLAVRETDLYRNSFLFNTFVWMQVFNAVNARSIRAERSPFTNLGRARSFLAIIGLIARAVMPGKQAIGLGMTIVLGVVGAIIGGLIGGILGGDGISGIMNNPWSVWTILLAGQ